MKYCNHCGKMLDDDAVFCSNCGQSTINNNSSYNGYQNQNQQYNQSNNNSSESNAM